MEAPRLREETLHYLAHRRSLTAAQMQGPGPTSEEVDALLRIAARVPDHRRVHPFRFIVFEGEARSRFGDILESAYAKKEGTEDPACLKIERERFERAPVVVAVVSAVNKEHKTPEWEQILTAGAVAQNLVIAAGAAGFAAQWLTEWYAYDEGVLEAAGLKGDERLAGWVYLGTPADAPKERARMDASALTERWSSPPSQG
ncbi:nitroreductase [Parvularcula sp. ZS-1/3]|uniref:Putative NAD(P)H nitroreductase n=2 Tax=Parvularcula mediterranea TaxID=2732508 RepID=A0A7Y3RK67_9PROT|nr:nitroreductase [Parvularcula mediterranea]